MSNENVLRIPTTPSMKACSECGKQATKQQPNLEYRLVGMTGVLCRECMQKEVANINAMLGGGE